MRASTKSPGTRAEACDAVRVHPANQSSRGRLATDFERMMTGSGADKMSRGSGTRSPDPVAKIGLRPLEQMIDRITGGIEHQMVAIPWFIMPADDVLPGRQFEAGDVGRAGFCALPVQ